MVPWIYVFPNSNLFLLKTHGITLFYQIAFETNRIAFLLLFWKIKCSLVSWIWVKIHRTSWTLGITQIYSIPSSAVVMSSYYVITSKIKKLSKDLMWVKIAQYFLSHYLPMIFYVTAISWEHCFFSVRWTYVMIALCRARADNVSVLSRDL